MWNSTEHKSQTTAMTNRHNSSSYFYQAHRDQCRCPEMGSFHQDSGFLVVPLVILEINLNLRRKFLCVYNQLWSCTMFYTDSVCPELAWRHTVWKWPSVARIHAFHGGLQARLWQAKIDLQSFVRQFSQAMQSVAWENFCFVRSSPHSPRPASMYKTSLTEVTL